MAPPTTIRLSLAFVFTAVLQVAAQDCRPGTYSTSGIAPCKECPSGTYQSNTHSTNCLEADAGYYAAGPGATTQTQCGDGYYSIGGTESCTPCPDGASCPGQGNISPTYTIPDDVETLEDEDFDEFEDDEYENDEESCVCRRRLCPERFAQARGTSQGETFSYPEGES
ncbi:hypothetical protein NM688_g7712 [Phlebia brevispora]|uniref:Uncharacterized protein n=1 Tax=Phlebia brevispora TaxID=194682 RepID=A0ACC1S2H7_9APHY|nr:hypothetical protein NM688_g7712 [Phlebia brevispora]